MKNTAIALALVGSAFANPMPAAVTSAIAPPQESTPAGCMDSYSGNFEIAVVNVTSSKRSITKRDNLELSLSGGKLTDQEGRTGYVASNYQFQFDKPPQAGALFTAGFSVCQNGSLALGGSAIWYQCYSGGFYNLYDRSWAAQCSPVYLISSKSGGSASQSPDGQPAATPTAAPVSQITDGQPQAATTLITPHVSVISDGQPQAPTGGVMVSVISDGQPQVPTTPAGPKVSVISDGQPQVPTAPVVSVISDGQPQVPTSPAASGPKVSVISDGQPQVPTTPAASGPKVSVISDGQPQVPTTPAPVAPTVTGPKVSQITDGQIQAPTGVGNNLTATATPPVFTGAANAQYGMGAFAAGLFGLIALV